MITATTSQHLWQRYQVWGRSEDRERLIEQYMPLVQATAMRMKPLLPDFIEEGDLLGYGYIGLVECIDRYDPQRHTSFETYATKRIHGAIVDGLRAMGWVPRTRHQKARQMQESFEALCASLGRRPTEEELAAYLGLSLEDYHQLLWDLQPIGMLSLEEVAWEYEDIQNNQAWEEVEQEELCDFIAAVLATLPQREQMVLALYYQEELTLAEIGEILGLTEARICQLKSQALTRLRTALQEEGYHLAR
ncbi:MAG TPA: FliA/WhiG family RNA polymerase sigma factor [Armatimonadetes bacterium]|nr:FliA/WhiG family RNA polymerase sigma factor [Armatimonadota bacterium]